MITMSEIARMCHVSQAVVSRALSNHPSVNALTREKIIRVANQYNYRPNALVRSLKRGQTNTIAIACNAIEDEFCGIMLRRVVELLQSSDYDTFLFNWDRCVTDHANIVQRVNERRADGLLMFPPAEVPSAEYRQELRAFTRPVVLFDQDWPGSEYDFVGFDNAGGSLAATRYLLDLGHRRIAYLHNDTVSSGRERKQGFLDAMIERGAAIRAELLRAWPVEHEAAVAAGRELLRLDPRPTAVACFNDRAAVAVMTAAAELGLQVPRDVSVIGFADLSIAGQWRPRLTTMRQDLGLAGEAVTIRMLERIKEQAAPEGGAAPLAIRLPVKLVERESCAAPAE